MQLETMTRILVDELKATAEDKTYSLPSGTKVTVFVSSGASIVPVNKITKLAMRDEYVILSSEEGRVFLDTPTIVALRADTEADKKDSKLGFGS